MPLLAWLAHRQGLDGALVGTTAEEVLARTGWSRSVGGCTPYLALWARAGLSREQVDAAVADGSICELPAARGCTYVVPQRDYAVALQAGRGSGESADIRNAKKHFDFTDAELERLCDAIETNLAKAPLGPDEIRQVVGDRARSLGDAGKKKGMSTTLPIALGFLQGQGRIRRIPTNGRLDQQRYRYAAWTPPAPVENVALELARRFFRWAAPATLQQFVKWSALTVKAAKAAVAELKLTELEEGLIAAEDVDAWRAFHPPHDHRIALVGSLDNILHFGHDLGAHGPGGGFGTDIPHHLITDRGRLIGFWDYDPARHAVMWATFHPAPEGVVAAVHATETYVREQLGDARTFSLDSPESRHGRLARLVKT